MNQEKVKKLINSYINNYERINNAEHREYYKWIAAEHFRKHWDMEADSFGQMFKRSLARSENMIDNSRIQPTVGIVYLCRQNAGTEKKVRDEFRKLLAPDEGNIKKRLEKIDDFVYEINRVLQRIAFGKWKYEQDRRAALMYLNFIDPADNFMYKATEVKEFAEWCEFDGAIGSGQTFQLDEYYRMCREFLEIIENQEELCALLERKLQELSGSEEDGAEITELPGKYNILAYDIMYCAHAYELYGKPKAVVQPKEEGRKQTRTTAEKQPRSVTAGTVKTGTAPKKMSEKDEQRNQLIEQKNALKNEKDALSAAIRQKALPDLTGTSVKNMKYGTGTVVEQNGKYLSVEFGSGIKKFTLPDAFTKKFLICEDGQIAEHCRELSALQEKEAKLATEIKLLDVKIR